MKRTKILALLMFFLAPIILLGQSKTTLMELLERRWRFGRLSTVFNETGQDAQLRKQGLIGATFTILAPTDRAFDAFGKIGLLRSPDPRIPITSFDPTDPYPSKPSASPDTKKQDAYIKFAQYHIIKGKVSQDQIRRRRRSIRTLAGKRLNPNEIREILFSIHLHSGIIHVIDKVLINPDLKKFLKIND